MMDLGLGGPVDVGVQADANHSGPCNDGVYGCSRCYNHANDGKGTVDECEWCRAKNVHCKITRSMEEPCLYAICEKCRAKQQEAIQREYEEEMARENYRDVEYPR